MALNNWHLVVCGISHKTSTLEQREPLQIGRDELSKANAAFRSLPNVLESTIVATCNRLEFYFVTNQQQEPFQIAAAFYDSVKRLDISDLETCFYVRRDKHAADHVFRVTSGLDSMVLGENEILGQVKDAYSSACAVKAAGKVLHRLFHQAFRIGKQVRSDTEMGKGACSVSGAAVELLKDRLGDLGKPTVLFVGINQMIALAASNLSRQADCTFLFANRTVTKAVEFAARYHASGHSLEELPSLLTAADIVITCTGSPLPIITHEVIDRLVSVHPAKKLTVMDMAVPRDVEFEKDNHPNIKLFDLEDVRGFVYEQQVKREQAIPESEAIVERRLDEFMYWFDHVRHEPVYYEFSDSWEAIRQQEIEAVLQKLEPDLRKKVDRATRRLLERLAAAKVSAAKQFDPSE